MYDIYGFKYEPRALEAEPDETLDSYVKRLDQRTQIDVSIYFESYLLIITLSQIGEHF